VKKSDTIVEISKALVKFQAKVGTIKKDADNPFFKSKYASLENILTTIRKDLTDNGLAISQFPTGEDELTTILVHSSGEYLQSTVKISPKDRTPQGIGSAITYMRRYALSAVLGLATDEDDDGNAASAARKPVPPAAPKAPTRPKLPADPFDAAVMMIDQAKDVDAVIAVSDRASGSDKLTEEQKTKIKKHAAFKVDSFDNVSQEAV
jgi:hypothetical protein